MTDKDYENFIARMGSFNDTLDLEDKDESLQHYGIPGMKWGKRKAAGYDVKGAKKKAFDTYLKDMKKLEKSGKINDAKEFARVEKKHDAALNKIKADAKTYKQNAKAAAKIAKADAKASKAAAKADAKANATVERRMSNKELNARLKRLRMEAEFNRLSNPIDTRTAIDTTAKAVTTIAALTGGALTIYNNVNKAVEIAKKFQS